jgi:tRNA-2-methylthio-N6-dimethylallyladenosine synthase
VPFTRGRERSRDPKSIVNECQQLVADGYKEVTLLGQNVDSYLWYGGGPKKDFEKLSLEEQEKSTNFANLLAMVAEVSPNLRVRFSTSHPKDMQDDVLHTIAKYENICNYIHLPVQSGNSRILELMNRGYSREWYLNRIESIRKIIPDCGISMDIISGFCTETEEDHKDTLTLMESVKYDFGYMFSYSERPNTQAQRKLNDDVTPETKKRRLQEIIDLQMKHSHYRNKQQIGKTHKVLVEGVSKKSKEELYGRNSQNTVIVFPKEEYKAGDYVFVNVEECTSATLKGKAIKRV